MSNKKATFRKNALRIGALVLAALMVSGSVFTIVFLLMG